MAYERRKETTNKDKNYSYVIVNEEDEQDGDSDSSDIFLNGPRKGKGAMQFNQRTQIILCTILVLALFLLVFVVYNFLAFIFAFQSGMHKLQENIPLICQTARMLNKDVAKGLKFCANVTLAPVLNTSVPP